MKPPITVLENLLRILNDRYSSFHSKQKDLSDFIEYDLEKLVEAMEQQDRDHIEQVDNLKDEIKQLESELEFYTKEPIAS